MVALPGTPLFGHGQAEGLLEKYGMEYPKSYFAESPDTLFLERHLGQITSLLERRELFASPESLRLFELRYDADSEQTIDAVFAFTNGHRHEHVLVLVNNSGSPRAGWLKRSTQVIDASGSATTELTHALGHIDTAPCLRGRDLRSGEKVSLPLEDGALRVELGPYQTRVLVFP